MKIQAKVTMTVGELKNGDLFEGKPVSMVQVVHKDEPWAGEVQFFAGHHYRLPKSHVFTSFTVERDLDMPPVLSAYPDFGNSRGTMLRNQLATFLGVPNG